MIGMAFCIGILIGLAFGVAMAWAYIEWQREREEGESPLGPPPNPNSVVGKMTAVLAKKFDAEFVENINRGARMADILSGKVKVEWSASLPRPATTPSGLPGPPEPMPSPEALSGLPVARSMASAGAKSPEPPPQVLSAIHVHLDRYGRTLRQDGLLDDLHSKVAESLKRPCGCGENEVCNRCARPPGPISARPCAKCGHPVGDHDPQLAGIVCPLPPEAA